MGFKKFLLIGISFAGIVLSSRAQTETYKEDSSRIEISLLQINSNRGDFSPFLSGNKLYFTSGRVHRYGLVYIDADTTKELEDVFYAVKNDSLHFKHIHYFSEKVNTKYNDGPLCFNKAGDVIYITGNDEKRMTKDVEPLDIFMVKKEHHQWGHPVSLPFCTGISSYCHPAIMRDGKTLIFSSNIPGGFGGMDLYISKFENENWSKPQNLGSSINSADNEVFPFVTDDGVLYFSSDRKPGIGGLDFYVFDLKDPISSALTLLSYPLNGPKDDFGIWTDSLGNTGYFSSNRGEGGDDNIYYFKNKYPLFESCTPMKQPTYCYTFFEESTLQAEDTLGMTYEWDLGDGTKMRGLRARHCFKGPGNYSVQLNIIDKASGTLFYNELSYDFTVEERKQLYIDCPDTIFTGKTANIDGKKSALAGHTIKEFFWFFGDERFSMNNFAQHTYKKDGDYIIQLGVYAKNDSTGKMKKFCTQKNVVVRDSLWLLSHKSMITKTSWPPPHKKTPVTYKSKKDSVNYRVHLGSSKENIPTDSKVFKGLKDVKKYKDKDEYKYTSGDVKTLNEAIPFYKKAREMGFKDAVVVCYAGDNLIPGQTKSMKGEIRDEKVVAVYIDTARIVYSNTILFDFDQSNFSKSYNESLDSVSTMLKKNHELKLVIFSISDTVGTNDYNYKLSKRRASSVKKYLIDKGAKPKSMDIFILGENVPLDYERRNNIVTSNRRVELLLVKNKK
jgi:outer membrane protein OmpA-like peptidoglycan-associated protein